MSSPAPFGSIAEVIERSVSIRHVYGEAVHHGDTTVIPVASVAYGFGAGGGRRPGRMTDRSPHPPDADTRPDAEGAGGGGGVRMTPAGVLEMGPKGTRFIHFHPLAPLFGVGAMDSPSAGSWDGGDDTRPARHVVTGLLKTPTARSAPSSGPAVTAAAQSLCRDHPRFRPTSRTAC
jgi:uncharacterized spore protein YtfJ